VQDPKSFPEVSSSNSVSSQPASNRNHIPGACRRLLTITMACFWLPLAAAQLPRAKAASVEQAGAAAQGKSTDDRPKTEPSRASASTSLASRFSLAFRTSTLGLGADAGFRVARPLNVRIGFNTFHYARTLTSDSVPYQGALRLRSMQVVMDWFPFSHSFHVGPGLLFYNGNRVTAVAVPPIGQVLTAGAEAYISNPQDPITGMAKSAMKTVAPMIVFGFGNLIPRNRHFAYSVDFGVVFQGAPQSTFTLRGGACDPSGEFCGRVADDSSIQADIQSARSDLDRHVSFMKYYPLMSVEFGYRF
jgi:hypothetical protein